jgi:hypothetical protein
VVAAVTKCGLHRRLRARRWVVAICFVLAASAACAQDGAGDGWSRSWGTFDLRGSVETYSAYYSMSGTWWNLAAVASPGFDKTRSFAELWVHPKLEGRFPMAAGQEAYGALTVAATQTIGSDAFDYTDEGAIRFGSTMLGVRGAARGWRYDVSFGRQPFTLGTGMLLTAGSSNGYSWGGGASAQRKTWDLGFVARASRARLSGTAFVLEPDEAPEATTETRVQGLALDWELPMVGKAGVAWISVLRSLAIYPGDLAPLDFIEQGRDGLDSLHAWIDVTGLVPALSALGLRAEVAQQRNDITRADGRQDPLKADAWMLGVSWRAQEWLFQPKFSYHVARFSGDKPETAVYERFDPLFWGNGLDNWWFGANGAYSWLDANLRAKRFIVDANLSAKDIVQIQHVRASADQVNSAVQFGQGARFTGSQLLVGVPEPGLSDEIYVQYSRVIKLQLIVTAFFARSSPRDGLQAAAPQGTQAWSTMGVGLAANF